jgi:non-ribosomal peptide synthetase component F
MTSIRSWAYQPDPYAFANFFPLHCRESTPFLTKSPVISSKEIELSSETDSLVSLVCHSPTQQASQNVVSLFRSIARRHPSTVAVDAGHFHLTYSELDELSTQLASHIRLHTVPGQPIPFLTELSASAVIGVLGILKAGAIYVPVDCSQWPKGHTTNVLQAIGGQVLVYSDQFDQIAKTYPQYSTVISVSDDGRISFEDTFVEEKSFVTVHSSLCMPQDEQELACVIFTSGTAGKPKGVMIRHEALTNFVHSRKHYLGHGGASRSLLTLSISFDGTSSVVSASSHYTNSETSV